MTGNKHGANTADAEIPRAESDATRYAFATPPNLTLFFDARHLCQGIENPEIRPNLPRVFFPFLFPRPWYFRQLVCVFLVCIFFHDAEELVARSTPCVEQLLRVLRTPQR